MTLMVQLPHLHRTQLVGAVIKICDANKNPLVCVESLMLFMIAIRLYFFFLKIHIIFRSASLCFMPPGSKFSSGSGSTCQHIVRN